MIDAMPPDALPSCLKPQATVVSVDTDIQVQTKGYSMKLNLVVAMLRVSCKKKLLTYVEIMLNRSLL